MVINKKASKILKFVFCKLYFLLLEFVSSMPINSSHVVIESSIILAKYFHNYM